MAKLRWPTHPSRDIPVGTFCQMADRYAPALFLEVLAFWFILRWLLVARLILFFGRAVMLLMIVGVLGTIDEHRFVWAACFAGSALLAWLLLGRWRRRSRRHRMGFRLPISLAWRGKAANEVATLCERRIGLNVDAAAPPRSARSLRRTASSPSQAMAFGFSSTSRGCAIRRSAASSPAGTARAWSPTLSICAEVSASSSPGRGRVRWSAE